MSAWGLVAVLAGGAVVVHSMNAQALQYLYLLADGEGPQGPSLLITVAPWLFIAAFFYLLFIRPDQKRRSETQSMLSALKKNDRVETIGGMRGVVVVADADEVVLRVDENTNTRLHFRRDAISRVLTRDKDEEKKESS